MDGEARRMHYNSLMQIVSAAEFALLAVMCQCTINKRRTGSLPVGSLGRDFHRHKTNGTRRQLRG
ncbi:hypothetical protein CA54_49550 [Symmachiella macrocystis]|uniref:Uncharacterized protein n=1 Tax=Symmachiella macrocystis TaxID=2527985 RepID=A0A5C6BCA2_9PLAN|nr:hypothetical protein CA54_49550 [Symmachiella macrocystis]